MQKSKPKSETQKAMLTNQLTLTCAKCGTHIGTMVFPRMIIGDGAQVIHCIAYQGMNIDIFCLDCAGEGEKKT